MPRLSRASSAASWKAKRSPVTSPRGAKRCRMDRSSAEALRVTAPGGHIVIADYHCPSRWHPLYYLFRPVLALLEPYALDLWRRDISSWLPEGVKVRVESHRTFFGGLYQLLVLVRE